MPGPISDSYPGTCEIRWCKSGKEATERTDEIIGDGCFSVEVCSDCKDLFGSTLPEPHKVEQALKKRLQPLETLDNN